MHYRNLLSANTPIDRIGVVLLAGACFVLFALALHWNVAERLFVYRQTYSWTVRVPQPTDGAQGAFWREASSGWSLYAARCIEEERRKGASDPIIFNLVLPESCAVRFVPHSTASRTEWKQSFGEFWRELTRGRAYTSAALCAIWLLVVGGLLRSGLASRLILWVKNGSREA